MLDNYNLSIECFAKKLTTLPGFEPGNFLSVVRHVIHLASSPASTSVELMKLFLFCPLFWICTLYIRFRLANLHTAVAYENIACCRKFFEKIIISAVLEFFVLNYGDNLCDLSYLQFC